MVLESSTEPIPQGQRQRGHGEALINPAALISAAPHSPSPQGDRTPLGLSSPTARRRLRREKANSTPRTQINGGHHTENESAFDHARVESDKNDGRHGDVGVDAGVDVGSRASEGFSTPKRSAPKKTHSRRLIAQTFERTHSSPPFLGKEAALSTKAVAMPTTGPHLTTPDRPMLTPSTTERYAAAGFSSSPAPSSLPIPKLFSRSVPSKLAKGGLQERLALESKGASTSALPLGPPPDMHPPLDRERAVHSSPLDIFFKADREEKARARVGHVAAPAGTPLAASASDRALPDRGRPIAFHHGMRPGHARHHTDTFTPDVFGMELDGEGGKAADAKEEAEAKAEATAETMAMARAMAVTQASALAHASSMAGHRSQMTPLASAPAPAAAAADALPPPPSPSSWARPPTVAATTAAADARRRVESEALKRMLGIRPLLPTDDDRR
ncbi:MAG: hypothetical protein M1826_003027 [Phylliscum demangeonii]|nr:MAG: hypothetical protein M1826_003027 [Phylliscum demangeonii]